MAEQAQVTPPENAVVTDLPEKMRSNRIQVSKDKKPASFFLNLAKRFLRNHEEVELSGLGGAIAPTVTLAEILKSQGLVSIARVETSLVDVVTQSASGNETVGDDHTSVEGNKQPEVAEEEAVQADQDVPATTKAGKKSKHGQAGGIPKPKIQIWIVRTKDFDSLIMAEEEAIAKRKAAKKDDTNTAARTEEGEAKTAANDGEASTNAEVNA